MGRHPKPLHNSGRNDTSHTSLSNLLGLGNGTHKCFYGAIAAARDRNTDKPRLRGLEFYLHRSIICLRLGHGHQTVLFRVDQRASETCHNPRPPDSQVCCGPLIVRKSFAKWPTSSLVDGQWISRSIAKRIHLGTDGWPCFSKRILRCYRPGFAKFCSRASYVWEAQDTVPKQSVNPAVLHRLGW